MTTILNPWFSIWQKPRQTLTEVIRTYGNKYDVPLSVLAGVVQMLSWASDKNLGASYSLFEILALCLLAGPVYGYVFLYVATITVRKFGNMLGGTGQKSDVRTAIAWASIPFIWSLVFWLPAILIWGNAVFLREPVEGLQELSFVAIIAGVLAIAALYYLYKCIYVFIQCIAEAHNFSAAKSLLTTFLSLITIILIGLLIAIPIAILIEMQTLF
ncbi:MAG: hypothetical protein DWQ10_16790 [Calditrichaeota bacterium]|nr:MAG: hypothetical protein DWQ10_16790 [Calditrichota bacterium]